MSSIRAGRDAISVGAGRDAVNIGNENQIVVNINDPSHGGTASWSQGVQQDSFQPSFHIPANPREIVLDFGNPFDYTQPQTQEAKVLQELLREDCDQNETRVITVYGKGGVGKSCILRALAVHETVKEQFQGGVYFLSLGMDAGMNNLIDGLVELTVISGGQELGRKLRGEGNLQVVLKKVREWLKGKKCLLLLDDFWERNGLGGKVVVDLAQMFSYRSGSVVALTTRFVSVATVGAEIEIQPHETRSERAEAILLGHAKFKRGEIENEITNEVLTKLLEMCGGLPLFLCVIGRAVAELYIELKIERRLVWTVYWEMMEGQEGDILLETESDEYPDLGKTLQVSLEILCNGRGKRFGSLSRSGYSLIEMHRALCVFKKQTAIPMSVCRRLWNVKSVKAAVRIGKGFAGVGLGDIEVENVGERRVVFMRLHDLVHIFALDRAKDKNEVAMWHERLLDQYISKRGGQELVRRWWRVEEKTGEEYLFENLCRHLASSGNVKELEELLLCGEWTKLRHKCGGLSSFKQDFSEYMGREAIVGLSEREEEIVSGVRMVRDAVVGSWAVVHENLHELGFQIFARLVDCKSSVIRRFLDSVEKVQCGLWLKPMQKLWTRPGEGGMIAEFHLGDIVWDIAVQMDLFIAAAAVGREIAVVDLKEMTVKSRCLGHTEGVRKVGISADGKRVFSWSYDCTVRQWDVQSGKEDTVKCIQLDDEDDEVRCVTFYAEMNLVITGSRKKMVRVWNLSSAERIGNTMYATKPVRCVGVSPNGRTIAAGVIGGAVLLWDLQTFSPLEGKLIPALSKVRSSEQYLDVSSIAFSPDDRFLASAGGWRESTIRLWDTENRTQVGDPFVDCKNNGVYSLMFSEDGQQIFSGHRDGSIIAWEVASRTAIRSWDAHSRSVGCVAMLSDGDNRWAVSGGMDCIMRVWDLGAPAAVKDERVQHNDAVSCIAASPDGQFFVSASRDRTLRTWDAGYGTALSPALCGHEKGVTCVEVSPDSRRVVSGSQDCTVRVWDVATGVQVGDVFRGHKEQVNCVAYSADGRFVVSGSDDCTARVWRVVDNPQSDENVSERASKRVRMAQDGECKVYSSRDSLRLEMTLHHEVSSDGGIWRREVHCVAVSPDGQRILCSLGNGEIWVWDTSCGECIYRTSSKTVDEIVRMEISKNNEVVTTNEKNEESWWRLDDAGGLMRVSENESTPRTVQKATQDGSARGRLNSVVCNGRTVQLSGSDIKMATLSEEVWPQAWKYNGEQRVLCAGLCDGRVMLFRVEG